MKITNVRELKSSPYYQTHEFLPLTGKYLTARHLVDYTSLVCINEETGKVSNILSCGAEVDEFFGSRYIEKQTEQVIAGIKEVVESYPWVGREE